MRSRRREHGGRIAASLLARTVGDAARLHRRAPTITTTTGGFTMPQRTWLITGVSSGFGREMTEQVVERGDRVVGTVRDTGKVADLRERYPEMFQAETLDVTDTAAIRGVVDRSFGELGRIDVIVSNAG